MLKLHKYTFLVCVLGGYFLALAFTYVRVYVYHAYPIYYSEEQMPSIKEQLSTLIYWPRL